MRSLIQKYLSSPLLLRVVPFLIFLLLTFLQGQFGEASRYWFYFAKTFVGAGMLWAVWPLIAELRWKISWEAVVVGILVFVMWVGLDGIYPSLGQLSQNLADSFPSMKPLLKGLGFLSEEKAGVIHWNPHELFGSGTALAWMFIVARIVGSTLVVPPLEEMFYRSFVYRYVIRPDFDKVPLGQFHWGAFLITSLVFGFAHHEWLAGILCGFAYQGLVIWKKRLGDAMTAHAITNLLLGLWIVWKGDWKFW